ncbi:MAG: sulfide-dependent adenosine diphosphate thiazole synthase, partial [Candidatus Omnitrophota bacterium]|nr:sulfide-dependent adenosine diphosphate thiazole synthase [Candidatus Omnitrophota bacterium]
KLDETIISKAIVDSFSEKLKKSLQTDVVIAGAGPAGLVAAYYLARKKVKVVLFERKLSIGGGIWGGGIMFNKIVVQKKARHILDEFKINLKLYQKGYYLADAVEVASTLCSKTAKAGVEIFNLMSVEDVMIRHQRVSGVVINWSAVDIAGFHVDPIAVRAKFTIDATGHGSELAKVVEKKMGVALNTETGRVLGEKPMWAEVGEEAILTNTAEIFPNLYVAGMAANAVYGAPRMGPIFGGMLLSGEKAAGLVAKRLNKKIFGKISEN